VVVLPPCSEFRHDWKDLDAFFRTPNTMRGSDRPSYERPTPRSLSAALFLDSGVCSISFIVALVAKNQVELLSLLRIKSCWQFELLSLGQILVFILISSNDSERDSNIINTDFWKTQFPRNFLRMTSGAMYAGVPMHVVANSVKSSIWDAIWTCDNFDLMKIIFAPSNNIIILPLVMSSEVF
jgi:hypothetical protein